MPTENHAHGRLNHVWPVIDVVREERVSILTLSRTDVYDYERCPKIVAIKTYRVIHPPKPKFMLRREPPVSRSLTGKIGELSTATSLSLEGDDEEEVEDEAIDLVESKLAMRGERIDGLAKKMIIETVRGLRNARRYIREEYGDVRVIGKGRCKNGPFPGIAVPDLVALTPKDSRPILIEVKNKPTEPSNADRFQARFYNTVARNTGVLVHEQRMDGNKPDFVPKVHHNSITDTFLIYPRGRTYEKVTQRVDLGEERLRDVWRAKQLGLLGKSPETDCDSKCPHHMLHKELPEGNLEPAKPIPLIYAKGLVESHFDFDLAYLQKYSVEIGTRWRIWNRIYLVGDDAVKKARLVEDVSRETRLPVEILRKMMFDEQDTPEPRKVLETMADEFEPWERLLNREWLHKVKKESTAKREASKVYPIPNGSELFVKQSWDEW